MKKLVDKPNVVMFVGKPCSGKSSTAKEYEQKGYVRLNRDAIGGKIAGLVPLMVEELQKGNNVLLDNTHCIVDHRKDFIAAAKQMNVPISCVWFNTSIEDCEINFCIRMIERYGKILGPEELKKHKDPNMFPPAVLGGFAKSFQQPTIEEGFDSIEEKSFKRVWDEGFDKEFILVQVKIWKNADYKK